MMPLKEMEPLLERLLEFDALAKNWVKSRSKIVSKTGVER